MPVGCDAASEELIPPDLALSLECASVGKQTNKGRVPAVGRDRFSVKFRDESAERLDLDFKPRAVSMIKITEADERPKGLTSRRKGPVIDQIELGLGWAVAIGGEVVADVLETTFQEVAFW